MFLLKSYLSFILLALPSFGHAQVTINNIPPSFTSFEYFPDSSLKTICQSRGLNNKLNGWAIEFDENGKPTGIGKYKNNYKRGVWHYSDLSIIDYKKSSFEVYLPPYCGISDMAWQKKFDKLITKHLKKR